MSGCARGDKQILFYFSNVMSRRKQAKPQYVLTDHTMENFLTPYCDVHSCQRCCAEFADVTDLHRHQKNCLKDQLVLIVSANESPDCPPTSITCNASHFNTEEKLNGVTNNNDTKELGELSSDEKSLVMNKSLDIIENSSYEIAERSHLHLDGNDDADDFSSAYSPFLPPKGSLLELCKLSTINSNVFIEILENTKVAVAQFSQENSCRNTSSSKMAASGLIEQLFALQQQQMQQLKLIEEIQQQILLLAAQNTDTPMAGLLIKLSSNLSEQLAAAKLAEDVASQHANAKQSNYVSQISQEDSKSDKENSEVTDNIRGNELPVKFGGGVCNQSFHNNTIADKVTLKQQSSSADSFINKLEAPHKQNDFNMCADSLPSIGAIVEDLNALTALAQQRKGKPLNLTFLDHMKRPSEDCILKHKCRFCAKVFGSDSALQIHLRSHTGERPYKCNICGNRFSTRGNLKVHFQRHKDKYPNIQMNPYPVPEHLDNIPTSTGIPYGMSPLPEKTAPTLVDIKHLAANSTGCMLQSSLQSLPPIKKEEEGVITPQNPGSSERCNGYQEGSSNVPHLISKEKFQEVTQALSLANFTSTDSSRNRIAINNSVDSRTDPKMEQFETKLFGRLPDPPGASETSKLEQLVENIQQKSSDPNECVICHRILSCQSALKMHYRTHTGERPFKCRVCGRAFTTKGNLKTHYSIHRSIPPLRIQNSCPICQEKFTNAIALQQHIHMHMGGHIPNVPLHDSHSVDQGVDSVDNKNLKDDYMEVVDGASDCNYPDSLPDSLRSSPSSSEFTRTTGLEGQLSNSLSNGGFTMQNRSMHKDCLTQKSLSLDGDYESHSSTNIETGQFWKTSSPNNFTLEKHERCLTSSSSSSTTGDISKDSMTMIFSISEQGTLKSNVCDVCNKTFACQSALDIHYRSHTKERPFICSACDRGFSTKGNLKQHMLTHQIRDFEPANLIFPPNKFLTSAEPAIPSKRTGLNCFIRKDPKDSTAGVVKSPASMLPILVSTGAPLRRSAKQHFCHTCGKSFSSSSALQIHERTHTGEKPFACNICGRAFTTKGNLKVHMGTHMWSSSPARRGRRLSVDGGFLRSNTDRFQDTPSKDVVRVNSGDSAGIWSHFASFTTGLALRANDLPVIQNGVMPHLSISPGHLESFEKLQLNRALPWLERLAENGATC